MPLNEIPLVHNRAKEVKHTLPDCTTPQGRAFWGARLGYHFKSAPPATKSSFVAMRCYKGETLVDAMVQTRDQQTGDQSPLGRGTLRVVTAEGDAASTAVTSGNTLKHAVSAPSAEHSAAILAPSRRWFWMG